MISRLFQRIFEILEKPSPDDPIARWVNTVILLLIAASVASVMLETVESIAAQHVTTLRVVEIVTVLAFTVEYVLRIVVCVHHPKYERPIVGRFKFAVSPMAIVDLVAILPFYLPMLLSLDFRIVRVLRIMRIFRILKFGRYSESLRLLAQVLRTKREQLLICILVSVIALILSSAVLYHAEHDAQPGVFSSIPATMWWGVATMTTVGYGDICPVTTLGKLFAGLVALFGIGLFALPAGIVASGFAEVIRREKRTCPHCGGELE